MRKAALAFLFFSGITSLYAQEPDWFPEATWLSDSIVSKEHYDKNNLRIDSVGVAYNFPYDLSKLCGGRGMFYIRKRYRYNYKNQLSMYEYQYICGVDTCMPLYHKKLFAYSAGGLLTGIYICTYHFNENRHRINFLYSPSGKLTEKQYDLCFPTYTLRQSFSCNGTAAVNPKPRKDTLPGPPEYLPQFPGGEKALKDFLALHYTPGNQCKKELYATYTIDKTGKVCDIKFPGWEKDPCCEAARKALNEMPVWIPGKEFGVKTDTEMTINLRHP
jgi:hypothetical protein